MENEQEEMELPVVHTRGFWLSAFLALMIVTNSLITMLYFGDHSLMLETYPKSSPALLYFLAILGAVNVVMSLGVWFWKKWGVFGLCGTAAIAFAINLYLGVSLLGSLSGFIGLFLLFLLVRNKWSKFT